MENDMTVAELKQLEDKALKSLEEMTDEEFGCRFGQIERDSWRGIFETDIILSIEDMFTDDKTTPIMVSLNDLAILFLKIMPHDLTIPFSKYVA